MEKFPGLISKRLEGRTPTRRMHPGFQVFMIICIFAQIGYSVYGAMTGSGLAGYVMQFEMAVCGVAAEKLTMLITTFLSTVPLVVILTIFGKVAPKLVWIDANASQPSGAGRPQPGPLERLNQPLQMQRISWKAVFWVTGIPIAIAGVLYPVLYYSDQRDQQEKVYSIDLRSGTQDPPKNSRFVELTGVMARPYALTYEITSTPGVSHSFELFAPIVGRGWNQAEPVRYFVRFKSEETEGAVQWPDAFQHRGYARFSGKIGRSLPPFVESRMRSKGLKLSAAYTVIDWRDLAGSKVPPSDDAAGAGVVCLGLSGCCLLLMVMLKFMLPIANRRRLRAYPSSQAAMGPGGR